MLKMHSGLFVDLTSQNMYKQYQDGVSNTRRGTDVVLKKDQFVLKCREPRRATRSMSRRPFTCILLNYQTIIFAIKIIKSYFLVCRFR